MFLVGSTFKTTTSSLAIAIAIGTFSNSAFAADVEMNYDTWYVSVFGGYNLARAHLSYSDSHYDIKLKDGFTVGAAVGSYVADGVRMERELSYVRNKNDSARSDGLDTFDVQPGHTSGVFLLNNIWKDIRVSDRFQPYFGGGIGAALLSGTTTNGESDDYDFSGELAFAMQAGVGARYAMTDRLALDVGYRYRAAMDATTPFGADTIGSAFSFRNHTVQAGLTYAFQSNGVVMPAAQGDSGLYASIFAGGVFPSTASWEYDGNIYALNQKTGFTVGAAIGTQLAPGLRGEAEFSHVATNLKNYEEDASTVDPASGTLHQSYFLLNAWKDFNLGMVQPYIGGGIGVGLLSFDNGVADGDDLSSKTGIGIAGQFGAGARVPVSDAFLIDVGYRYKSIVDGFLTGGGDFSENYDIATHNHIFQVGGTYVFGGAAYQPAPEMTDKYVSVFGGLSQTLDNHFMYSRSSYIADHKMGFTVGAAIGGNINENLRGELELSFVKSDIKQFSDDGGPVANTGGDVNSYYLLANLWRDVDLGQFKPYVGGGLGVALLDADFIVDGDDPNQDTTMALAGQVGAGIRFDVTDRMTLDAGYRMKAALAGFTSGTNGGDHTFGTYYTHVGQVGLSWKF
jgi:opacity protein-like surface antigen